MEQEAFNKPQVDVTIPQSRILLQQVVLFLLTDKLIIQFITTTTSK